MLRLIRVPLLCLDSLCGAGQQAKLPTEAEFLQIARVLTNDCILKIALVNALISYKVLVVLV